ncbi:MAG: hypothetical protein ACREQK_18155, partial [Candidatus Binatia bacterium]
MPLGRSLGVGKVDSPDVRPLIPDAAAAEAGWHKKTGIHPINHPVVVKAALLQSDPSLAPRLFAGFEAAKAQFLKHLAAGAELPAEAQALAKRRSIVGNDPLPTVRNIIERRWRPSSASRTPGRSCRARSSRRRCSRPTRPRVEFLCLAANVSILYDEEGTVLR